ncbi:MAG: YcaO-like family protein [Desulfovibrio sp.]|nr:YcaO-like family protein [Desulfovibrio sp.]
MKATPIILKSCPKKFDADQAKAVSPAETIANLEKVLGDCGLDLVADARRVDTGRLDIPVYLSVCGVDAREIMPVRKQMGKGASPEQAKASALMELMERFSFFSFFAKPEGAIEATWSEAEKLFGDDLIPIEEILKSVEDPLPPELAKKIMNLARWIFYPATNLRTGRAVWLPLDWFRMLGEFNGSSAGNAPEESLAQGLAELIERHVCAIADRERPRQPTIKTGSIDDPILRELIGKFERQGVQLILKDFSMDMPLPTVAALAWDPASFPDASEIVFTAGTASSPAQAAIRAVTEVAQLAGDFHTRACYEASGLPKFENLSECAWLMDGEERELSSLPSVEHPDIREELRTTLDRLHPFEVYAVETTRPDLGIPAHWCVAPGLKFRERARDASLGMFVGRKLAESGDPEKARAGLRVIGAICPGAAYLPFFQGLIALSEGAPATSFFIEAYPLQTDPDSRALTAFYAGYSLTRQDDWRMALPWLSRATADCPQSKDYWNLLGAALYKLKNYERAEECFNRALKIDKGSAIDLANRGVCRLYLGRPDEATKDLEIALSLDPSLDFARARLEELKTSRE